MAGRPNGVFNFEGGCYAKTIRLSREAEPEIYATTKRFGTVLENVVLDPVTRAARLRRRDADREHPLRLSARLHPERLARPAAPAIPKNIVMLTADAFGVLPPIAKLTPRQAMYHFLSGYTAKVAGTEKGVTEPEATFSTCFGAPFMPRHPVGLRQPAARADRQARRRLLAGQHRLDRRQVRRRPAHADQGHARAADRRARRLAVNRADFRTDPYFGFAVPTSVPGVEPHILDPLKTWPDKAAFAETAKRLVDDVQRELQALRGPCRRRREGRRAADVDRGVTPTRHPGRREAPIRDLAPMERQSRRDPGSPLTRRPG